MNKNGTVLCSPTTAGLCKGCPYHGIQAKEEEEEEKNNNNNNNNNNNFFFVCVK